VKICKNDKFNLNNKIFELSKMMTEIHLKAENLTQHAM